ncbi:hypothetical protein ACFWJE_05675 [Streptomyces griseoincarnatus]
MDDRNSNREKVRTIAIVLMVAVILAFLAGLLGSMLQRDPVDWGAWTFEIVAPLGIAIVALLWATEGPR